MMSWFASPRTNDPEQREHDPRHDQVTFITSLGSNMPSLPLDASGHTDQPWGNVGRPHAGVNIMRWGSKGSS